MSENNEKNQEKKKMQAREKASIKCEECAKEGIMIEMNVIKRKHTYLYCRRCGHRKKIK